MVMLTHRCSLRCSYCGVVRDDRTMTWPVLRKALDLLLTSTSPNLQLRYFGGEPLLCFGLIRKAVEAAEASGRKVHHMITTNGLGLDAAKLSWLSGRDAEVLFSLDGGPATHLRWRPSPSGRDVHSKLVANIKALQRSGVSYFVNLIVHPGEARTWGEDLDFVLGVGVRRLQIGYAAGTGWDLRDRGAFLSFMESAARLCAGSGIELLNLKSGAEPVMLSEEVIAETDGRLYLDPAVFMERFFPGLKAAMLLGRLGEVRSLAEVRRTRAEVLRLFTGRCPASTPEGKLLADNLRIGLETGRLMGRLRRSPSAAA
jgi:hypothetical protein